MVLHQGLIKIFGFRRRSYNTLLFIIIGNLVENDVYSIQGYFLIIPVLKYTKSQNRGNR
jgi:hypothetical protein